MIGFVPHDDRERTLIARRCDWRFLLPNPRPASVVALAGGTLGKAVAREFPAPAAAPADLLISLDPRPEALRHAFESLADGGTIYAEWRTPAAFFRRRIEKALEKAGFEDLRFYAARPDPERRIAGAWLPLDQPAPTGFFLARQQRHPRFWRRVVQTARRAVWSLGPSWRLTSPLCATGRKPSAARGEPRTGDGYLPEHLLGELLERWQEFGPGGRPPRLEFLLLTPGGNALNKLVLLVFTPGSPEPCAAIKLARVQEAVSSLEREAAALQSLVAAEPVVSGVPRLLFAGERRGIMVVAESAIVGQKVDSLIDATTYGRLATAAAGWSLRLGQATRRAAEPSAQRRYIDETLHAFRRDFGPVLSTESIDLATRVTAGIPELDCVREQRDFSPWNILVGAEGDLRVLDWESSVGDGLPAMDLIYFLTYSAFYVEKPADYDGFANGYRMLWGADGHLSADARRAIASYADGWGLPPEALPALRLLTWIVHSRSEYARMVAATDDSPDPGTLRQSLFLRLFEEEIGIIRSGRSPGRGE